MNAVPESPTEGFYTFIARIGGFQAAGREGCAVARGKGRLIGCIHVAISSDRLFIVCGLEVAGGYNENRCRGRRLADAWHTFAVVDM